MSVGPGPTFTYEAEAPRPDAPPLKVCRKCSVQTATHGEFCPHCGAAYVHKVRLSKRSMVLAAIVVAVALASVGTGLRIQNDREARAEAAAAAKIEDDRKQAEAEAERVAANEAASKQRAEAAERQKREAERQKRADYLVALEAEVVRHAEKNVEAGFLTGPILKASCTPLGGGSTDDLTALTGQFDCIAVNRNNDDGTQSGYGYQGTINYSDGSMTWRLGNP